MFTSGTTPSFIAGGLVSTTPSAPPPAQTYAIQPEHELRFEVEMGQTIKVQLLEGTAECFGAEMARDREYTFSGTSSAIFTWHGCLVKIEGHCHAYIADETVNAYYWNTHYILQQHRERAHKTGTAGPKAIILGSTDSGKSTLSRILCNLAARSGEEVTYVDLDVGQGSITIPGMIAAASIDKPIDISYGFDLAHPLVYFFGTTSLQDNMKLYLKQLQPLANQLEARANKFPRARAGGMIINTCGWVDGDGYTMQLNTIEIFNPDYIFVIAHERLYSDLQTYLRTTNKTNIQLVKLPKSGGVVTRDRAHRRKCRFLRVKEYFYGCLYVHSSTATALCGSAPLFPQTAFTAPATALPIGVEPAADPTKLHVVQPSQELLHSVLAVSYAKSVDTIYESSIAGFLLVVDVNMQKRKMTVLSPQPELPSKILLVGSLKHLE